MHPADRDTGPSPTEGAGFLKLFAAIEAAALVVEAASGEIVLWNRAAEGLFGYAAEEVLGKPLSLLVPTHLRAQQAHGLARYAGSGKGLLVGSHLPMQVPACRKDGTCLMVEVTLAPVDDLQRVGRFVLGVVQDLSYRAAPDELIARQGAELGEATAALKELESHKDEFLSVLSHELRTPLNPILGFSSLLLDGQAGELAPEVRTLLEGILTGAERLLEVVGDLLDVATIQAGRFVVHAVLEPFRPLVDATVESIAPRFEARGVTLECEVDGDPAVAIEARRIVQVLDRLLANALEATPAGGRVVVRVIPEGATIRTEVQDTGRGLAPADLRRLFDHDRPFDPEAPGGLGLTLARATVEAHGGRLGAESSPGSGSTFWFTLPAG